MEKTTRNSQFYRYKLILFNLLLMGAFVMLTPLHAASQIVLHDDPITFKPTQFYIISVNDERNPEAVSLQGLNFEKGTAAAIYTYLTHNLSKDVALRPVVISIKELRSTEKNQPDGRTNGIIQLHFSFGLQKDYGIEHLVDYQGKIQYSRTAANPTIIEINLRQLIKASLNYFNNWIEINAPINRKLASRVKIIFNNYTEKAEGDTIYYAANRPLKWTDFQSRIRPASRYQALVIPGIAYDQEVQIVKGSVIVQIAIKAFLPKSAAWADLNSRDSYTLNHEQRHFDIAKIISEEFQHKILAEKLTPDNFEGLINMQYLDTLRELNTMQNAYDNETSHGLNRSAQSAWNERIDVRLKENL